jgi:hypothetical protein
VECLENVVVLYNTYNTAYMDDYSLGSLSESKNEWCARLVNTVAPCIAQGMKSIFQEAWKLCEDNDEVDKYLMTFQNFLGRVPKWNSGIIATEVQRIMENSGCKYLEELITCVHIIQLKALACVRVGQEQKKIDINVPSVNDFIHKVYINVARKVYTNVYLFEMNIPPLQIQKNNWALDQLIREAVLTTVRDNIPVETLLRAYMDESEEQAVKVKEVEEIIEDKPVKPVEPEKKDTTDAAAASASASVSVSTDETPSTDMENVVKKLDQVLTSSSSDSESVSKPSISFNDVDKAVDIHGQEETVVAPKSIERLTELSNLAYEKRKAEEAEDEDDDKPLVIGSDLDNANDLDFIKDLSEPGPTKLKSSTPDDMLGDVMVLL